MTHCCSIDSVLCVSFFGCSSLPSQGNSTWSSRQRGEALYHTGTIPDKKKETFVSDLRCMVSATQKGFQPLAAYARRAQMPLLASLPSTWPQDTTTWGMLGTNLSIKQANGEWATDTSRLLLMDMKDFNKLGIAIDDLSSASGSSESSAESDAPRSPSAAHLAAVSPHPNLADATLQPQSHLRKHGFLRTRVRR